MKRSRERDGKPRRISTSQGVDDLLVALLVLARGATIGSQGGRWTTLSVAAEGFSVRLLTATVNAALAERAVLSASFGVVGPTIGRKAPGA